MSEEHFNPYKSTTHVNEKTYFSWPVVVVAVGMGMGWATTMVQLSYLEKAISRLEAKAEAQNIKIGSLELSIANICNNTRNCKMVTK